MEENTLLIKKIEAARDFFETVEALKTAKDNLELLKEQHEEYLKLIEKESLNKIQDVFEMSESILKEINSNFELLTTFKEKVEVFSNSVYLLADDVRLYSKDFVDTIEKQDNFFADKTLKLEYLRQSVINKQDILNGEKHQLQVKTKILEEETIAMKDKRAAFDRAYTEINYKINADINKVIEK